MKRIRKLKRVAVFYFLVATLFPLVVFGGISIRHASISLKKEILDKKLYLTHSVAYAIDSQVEEWTGIADICLKVLSGKDALFIEEYLASIVTNYDFVENIVYEDFTNGKTFIVFGWGYPIAKQELKRVFYKNKNTYLSKTKISPITKEALIWFGAERNGSAVYLLINLNKIQSVVLKAVSESGALCIVLDDDDRIIVHPYRSKIMSNPTWENLFTLGYETVNAETILLKEGKDLFVGVVKHLQIPPWHVVAIAPTVEIFSDAYYLLKVSIFGIVIATIIAVGLSLYLSRRVSRPLSQLASVAKEIAGGNYEVSLPKTSYAELNELALHMKRMTSALKEREEELRLGKERYRELYEESKRREELHQSLLDASPDPIVIYDLEGRVNYLNSAFEETFGWSLEELRGKGIPFVPEEEKERTYEAIRQMIATEKKVRSFQTKRYTKDGRLLIASISSTVYKNHLGNPEGILVILRDITESKRLEEQFFAAQRLESLGTLAGGIAHNFNNILMGIQGNASLLSMELPRHNPSQRRISNVLELVKRAAGLTSQLLGFARGGKYQPEPLDINEVVKRNLEVFSKTRHEIKIVEDLWGGPLIAEGDQSQIEQVIVNLLENAYQAMPEGGTLFVETAPYRADGSEGLKEGDYVKISIRDTGIGMDEETKARIFEPFFTTKPVGVGTGLGLSAVYGIVLNHNGHIEVETEKGKGTTFYIYLPLLKKEDVAHQQGIVNFS
ncbi:MAG: PAS domain S-box protein [Desulfatiglandales bacterium]